MAEINRILEHSLYVEDLRDASLVDFIPWEKLQHKVVLVVGATGMIGSCLIDLLMYCNEHKNADIKIIAISRNESKAKERFEKYWNNLNFKYIQHDCSIVLPETISEVDYAIHAASNTHPIAYSTDPIGTISTNVFGTYYLLEHLKRQNNCRVLFVSSVEIYGENNTDKIAFSEKDFGYLDCNTLRAGYPESKRVAESLCQAYISKYNMDIVIARLCRVFGPTMLDSDSKALSQFIRKAVKGEDIILKSEGKQYYSYVYVFDAVSALLTILLKGKTGEAYNVADEKSNTTLKALTEILANFANKKVIFELPDAKEKNGYSVATKAILDSKILNHMGWKTKFDITNRLIETCNIIKNEC